MLPAFRRLAPTALLLLVVACAAPTGGPTGSLQVDISGLPQGEEAAVSITGPGNYGAKATESTTLNGLTPGTYEIEASNLTTTAVTSEYLATITPDTLDVTASETATATVEYALRGGALAISISGLPTGLDADASVTGPDGFDQDLTASTVLDVAPGEYTATANPVTEGNSTYTPTVVGSPVEVSSATGAGIDIVYALEPGSLDLIIAGLPAGSDADVSLDGTDGFSVNLTGSTIVPDLPPGRYGITVNDVSVGLETYTSSVPSASVEVASSVTEEWIVSYDLVLGTLTVTIDGPPAGLVADVLVEGPGGYAQGLTSSAVLVDLLPGAYTLTTSSVRLSDPIVDRVYGSPGATFEVMSGSNAIDATYLAQPSSGRMWTPHSGTTITTGFTAVDLVTTGSQSPSPVATLTGPNALHQAIAFDGDGNAWITNQTSDRLELYLASDLATDGSPTPTMTIGGLADPVGLAFDASGNLFVANRANDTVVMFTPDQRLTSGNPTPAVTISSNTGSLGIPGPIAFDASGSLWVTNGAGTIVRFGASQLTSSGSPVPEVTIDDGAGGNLVNPSGLAFDAAGDLWVADFAGTPIVKFVDPGSLAGAVNPTPAVTLTGVANPSGVLFDNSGSLWVLSFASNVLFRFNSPGLLSGAVSPAADAMIDGAASINDGLIALYPPPVGLPIITP